jgi:hypothetical protein
MNRETLFRTYVCDVLRVVNADDYNFAISRVSKKICNLIYNIYYIIKRIDTKYVLIYNDGWEEQPPLPLRAANVSKFEFSGVQYIYILFTS